ncbi:hypothetical protein MM188_003182 [Vibrio cholerae]|nr:hypothetical protein [Vibrio cholerae]
MKKTRRITPVHTACKESKPFDSAKSAIQYLIDNGYKCYSGAWLKGEKYGAAIKLSSNGRAVVEIVATVS